MGMRHLAALEQLTVARQQDALLTRREPRQLRVLHSPVIQGIETKRG
jgi:hypothetical protein